MGFWENLIVVFVVEWGSYCYCLILNYVGKYGGVGWFWWCVGYLIFEVVFGYDEM